MNDTSAAAEISLAENFQRQAMNPADECIAFRHFIDAEGKAAEDVARRFGLTTRFVEGRIRLAVRSLRDGSMPGTALRPDRHGDDRGGAERSTRGCRLLPDQASHQAHPPRRLHQVAPSVASFLKQGPTMTEIVRIETDRRRSRVVVYNGIVSVGGMAADDHTQDIEGQTRQALAKLDAYLAQAGTDKSRLLTAQIWLKDIARDFKGMNRVWNAWTTPDAAPTRATAQCEMGAPDVLVEIIATAATAQ
jgi:enamine deaminase RidA (YjgF/YER057c/UK114 family)